MTLRELTNGDSRTVHTVEYDDSTVLVADLRIPDENLDLDVVGQTGIIIVTADGEERQFEFDLPAGDVTKAIINNGVVTIEVRQ